MFERDLAGGCAAELEMGIESTGAPLVVQVRRLRLAAWRGLWKECPDPLAPHSPSAGIWSFSSLLHKGPSQPAPTASRNWWHSMRGRARPEAREWVGAGLAMASRRLSPRTHQ